jgi:DUF1680 family protein
MDDVQWTKGFWAERFAVCKDSMVPNLWHIYNNAEISHAFRNFEIAAGLDTGSHKGPSFHDGDYYKTLEALAGIYALTKDSWLVLPTGSLEPALVAGFFYAGDVYFIF